MRNADRFQTVTGHGGMIVPVISANEPRRASLIPCPDRSESVKQPERPVTKISAASVPSCEEGRTCFAFSACVRPISKTVPILTLLERKLTCSPITALSREQPIGARSTSPRFARSIESTSREAQAESAGPAAQNCSFDRVLSAPRHTASCGSTNPQTPSEFAMQNSRLAMVWTIEH